MGKIIQSFRTTMPFDGGLSPLTDKSTPTHFFGNTPLIQDIISGQPVKNDIHSRDSNWGAREDKGDESHSYREGDDEFMIEDKILKSIRDLMSKPRNLDVWVVETTNGNKIEYTSLESIHEDVRKGKVKIRGVHVVHRQAQAKAESANPFIQSALDSCCTTNSIIPNETSVEIGAAFCVMPGYFLTCAHCVRKYNKNKPYPAGKSSPIITLHRNEHIGEASLFAIDYAQDIAILESKFPATPLAIESGDILVGDRVFVVGSPKGFENNVSDGIVSSVDRKLYYHAQAPTYLFTDAQILPGNSGGPVLSYKNGKVLGMVQMIVAPSGSVGLNAALEAKFVRDFIKSKIG